MESLLYYSRIGRAQLATAKVDLNILVQETLEMIDSRLSESNAEIIVAENLPTIEGDEVLLREVFTNLISNAVKYNDKEIRRVEVGFSDAATPTFFVRDNGIGIAEKHYETIFRIFKRLHGRDKFGGGVGAGLTITKKIVERHGGNLRLESVPNEGTTFYFTLGEIEKN
jgi:two-component system, chemotaxis family, sensor kinase Cph1